MKKKLIFVTFICLGIFIYNLKIKKKESLEHKTEWKVFKVKDKTKKTKQSIPTKKDLISARIPEKKIKILEQKISYPKRNDRRLIGKKESINTYKDESINLEFLNSINENWKQDLIDRIARTQRSDTEIFIKKENSFIQIKNNKGLYVEHVLLAIKRPDDLKQSYEALIDSETGKVIKTWNSITYEKKSKKPFLNN